VAWFSRSPVVRRRRDGRFDLVLDPMLRTVLRQRLGELDELLEADPHDPALLRLRPPAYLDDPDRDAAYQLLAGEELRASRRAAIARVVESLDAEQLTEDDLWAWLQALNAVRLVLGTTLDVSEDEGPPPPTTPVEEQLVLVYELTTLIQYEVVRALG
jgi:hypothetical protein